jgi:hypothetical protein
LSIGGFFIIDTLVPGSRLPPDDALSSAGPELSIGGFFIIDTLVPGSRLPPDDALSSAGPEMLDIVTELAMSRKRLSLTAHLNCQTFVLVRSKAM